MDSGKGAYMLQKVSMSEITGTRLKGTKFVLEGTGRGAAGLLGDSLSDIIMNRQRSIALSPW